MGGQRHAPAALPPGKTQYPLYRMLGWPQGRSGPVQKTSPPSGFDPRTVQPVASRYTDYTIPAHMLTRTTFQNDNAAHAMIKTVSRRLHTYGTGFSPKNLHVKLVVDKVAGQGSGLSLSTSVFYRQCHSTSASTRSQCYCKTLFAFCR